MPKIALPYIRMSTAEQLKGRSLDRQYELIHRYAEKNNLEIDWSTKYQDIGRSAWNGKHLEADAGLGKFIAAIEVGAIKKGSCLLIESLDRLSRLKLEDALPLYMYILKSGCEIHTIGDSQQIYKDPNDVQGLILSILQFDRANNESSRKSELIRDAWAELRRKARTEKIPITKRIPAWLYIDDGKFKTYTARVEIVQRIYNMKLCGLGANRIAYMFNEEKIPVFGRGKKWHESYIKKILTNESVIGTYIAQKLINGKKVFSEKIEDYYPPIINKKDFERASLTKAVKGQKSPYFSNLFAGIATCKKCGSRMTMVNKGKSQKGRKYLACSNAKTGMGCDLKTGAYNLIERNVLNFIDGLDIQAILNFEVDTDLLDERNELQLKQQKSQRALDKYNKLIDIYLERDDSEDGVVDLHKLDQLKKVNKDNIEKLNDVLRVINSADFKGKEFDFFIDKIDSEDYILRSKVNTEIKSLLQSLSFEIHGAYNRKVIEIEIIFKGGYKSILLIDKRFSENSQNKVLTIPNFVKNEDGKIKRRKQLHIRDNMNIFKEENDWFHDFKRAKILELINQ
ncbi:MAG: recombinase family protein [Colwellia sp.]|jgi:Site-specific recombinases, DNA invertase Pin homologs